VPILATCFAGKKREECGQEQFFGKALTHMALSEFAIRKAKQKDKPYRIPDGEGLNLLIQPNGVERLAEAE